MQLSTLFKHTLIQALVFPHCSRGDQTDRQTDTHAETAHRPAPSDLFSTGPANIKIKLKNNVTANAIPHPGTGLVRIHG